MNHLLSILLTAILSATASAQTIKSLGYNSTNGQVVANTGTNVLTFTNAVAFSKNDPFLSIDDQGIFIESTNTNIAVAILNFNGDGANKLAANTRANLGFSTNLNTLWTATNAANSRSAVGLGATWLTNTNVTNFKNATELQSFRSPDNYATLYWGDTEMLNVEDGVSVFYPIYWSGTNGSANAATTRTNLGIPLAALTNTSNVTLMRALAGVTNGPVTDSITLSDGGTSWTLTFSNGILVNITEL